MKFGKVQKPFITKQVFGNMSDSNVPPPVEDNNDPKPSTSNLNASDSSNTGDVEMKSEESKPSVPEEPPIPEDVLNATPEE